MTRLLASVRNVQEARLALRGGTDLIDLKEPNAGALGAVPLARIKEIRSALGPDVLMSATIGDRPMQADLLSRAVIKTAETGVDYVKVGFSTGGDRLDCMQSIRRLSARGIRIVAVLFADQGFDPYSLDELHDAGVHGAMLDTAAKHTSLRQQLDTAQLQLFVRRCRALNLLCGLAGSLRLADVDPLLRIAPDYLGFRGALCNGDRRGRLNPQALGALRKQIPVDSSASCRRSSH